MFFFFGWGHTMRKDIGPAFNHTCPNCHNESLWEVQRISVWFTLFFIPVFPYEWKYFLYCPVCSSGVELDHKQRESIVPLAEANKLLLAGKISEHEHQYRISKLHSAEGSSHNTPKTETPERTPPAPSAPALHAVSQARPSFCTHCGTRLDPAWKFCNDCGKAVG